MRTIIVLSLFLIPSFSQTTQAAESIPPCRYDNELVPIVRQAVDWAVADYKASNLTLPFDRIVYNSNSANASNALSILIVKDATKSTVDSNGCILKQRYQSSNGFILKTDGECLATNRSECTSQDDKYMLARYKDIHGLLGGESETGYSYTGACYMTNMQACIHKDRIGLLEVLGTRDSLSVKGTCVAKSTPPMSIRCSAGALKMLISRPAAKKLAPTVGVLFVMSHELAHLIENVSSHYDVSAYAVDRAWPREDKFTIISNQCLIGNSLRKREESADKLAVMVIRQHLKEISKRWPKQGDVSWLITQAIYYSTNLVRWNNDWQDADRPGTPKVFSPWPNRTFIITGEKEMAFLDKEDVPSGFSEMEIRARAKNFLCELAPKKQGKWRLLMQSGSTHGTMVERLAAVFSTLRDRDDLGRVKDLPFRRARGYLREIEGEICDLIDRPLQCPG